MVQALVLAGVARDESRRDLAGPWFVAVPAADEPLGVGGVQFVHARPRLVLQLTHSLHQSLELGGDAGVLVGAGPYVRGPQCHRCVAQKPDGILKVGHVVHLNAGHAPDPHCVHGH